MIDGDSLWRQCRTLESLFDSELTSYGRLAATISHTGPNDYLKAGPSWCEAESEVEGLLERVFAVWCILLLASQQANLGVL